MMLTMFDDDDADFAAMRAGARGYLIPRTTKAEILRAVHAVNGGEVICGATIANGVVRHFANIRPARGAISRAPRG
ncbi:MAG: hypothetical protein ABI847_09760 [Anaerolineales bacterium]